MFPGPLTGGTKKDRTEGQEGKFKIGQEGAEGEVPGCIVDPNSEFFFAPRRANGFLKLLLVHTQNETMASGTAFAISYTSDLKKVTPENLVVFTVLEQSVIFPMKSFRLFTKLPPAPPSDVWRLIKYRTCQLVLQVDVSVLGVG